MCHHQAPSLFSPGVRVTAPVGAASLRTNVADFLYNDKTSQEDVYMEPTPTPEGDLPQRMTITEIAKLVGRSRQLIHGLATKDPNFPAPQVEPGSTRLRYDRAEIEAWWASREVRQGRRTDLENRQAAEGEEVSTGHAPSQPASDVADHALPEQPQHREDQ